MNLNKTYNAMAKMVKIQTTGHKSQKLKTKQYEPHKMIGGDVRWSAG